MATENMTVEETVAYLDNQARKRWPGSVSIGSKYKPHQKLQRDNERHAENVRYRADLNREKAKASTLAARLEAQRKIDQISKRGASMGRK